MGHVWFTGFIIDADVLDEANHPGQKKTFTKADTTLKVIVKNLVRMMLMTR